MNEEEVLIVRKNRRRIAELCNDIFWEKWDAVCIEFHEIEEDLARILKEDAKEQEILRQCRQCLDKRNTLRFRDLLAYELDDRLAEWLFSLSERERISLANYAKTENRAILRACHPNIYNKFYNEGESQVECHYEGTDNITLTARENEHSFRIFSNTNPWRESIDFVNYLVRENKEPQEICVLGFGGGYTVWELIRRFPLAIIKIFIPDIAVFRAVVDHILVDHILKHPNVKLYSDYDCFAFSLELGRNMARKKNFIYYIDRRELRINIGSIKRGNGEFFSLWYGMRQGGGLKFTKGEDTVGERIKQYIENITDNKVVDIYL